MTLNEMTVAALQQLKRGCDSQTIDNYRGVFTQYANMAQQDLGKAFMLYRTDDVIVEDGVFDAGLLPRWCVKIVEVTEKGKKVDFDRDKKTGLVKTGAKKVAQVRYRYLPKPLENPTDCPDLPLQLHQCIVSYMVACDRSGGDASTQGGASVYFRLYNEQKKSLLKGKMGMPESYRIENVRY